MQQLRDNKGRFVKGVDYGFENHSGYRTYDPLYDDEEELKIAPSVRLAIWLSHNRYEIVGYIAYAALCLGMGMIGGVMGVRLSL